MTVMMQGPALLRTRVVTYLAAAVPPLIDIARTQWGVTAQQLPYPVKYDAADPYIVAEYPVMGMYVVTDRDHIHRDVNGSAEREYFSRYGVRLFVVAETPKDAQGEFVNELPFEETMRTRDNLRTVLVNALLQSPSLGGHDMEVLEETIATDYDEPMRSKDKRHTFVSAAVVNVDINMTESLYLPPFGTVETVQVQVQRVPWGEELP
jgi:hypothetical protein